MRQQLPAGLFAELDTRLRDSFLSAESGALSRYETLFRYFVAGFLAYRQDDGAGAHYPGLASRHGHRVDSLEGFSRMAPLIAAWLASGRPSIIDVPGFGRRDLEALLVRGIEVGVNPAAAGYWGRLRAESRELVEAADIALAVWLARDLLMERMSVTTRARFMDWLATGQDQVGHGSNALSSLFPLIVSAVAESFGARVSAEAFSANLERVTDAYAGEGWFRNEDGRRFDYSSAWGFHYGLYWLGRISTQVDDAFIRDSRNTFVRDYRYLMTPEGTSSAGPGHLFQDRRDGTARHRCGRPFVGTRTRGVQACL